MPLKLTNHDIAKIFHQVSAVLQATGADRFRIRAYDTAADAIDSLTESLESLHQQKQLQSIPGIGPAIAAKITDLLTTGQSPAIDKILTKVPPGMLPLLDIPGIGPQKAYTLATTFKLNSQKTAINQLIRHATKNHIASLEGFGAKSQAEILQALAAHQPTDHDHDRIRLDQADAIAQHILDYINTSSVVAQASVLGSLRRRRSTTGDIDIGVATASPDKFVTHLTKYSQITKLISHGQELVRFFHSSGQNIDVKIVDPESWGSLLQHFTGSKAHNIALRELALTKGLSLSEHGIKKSKQLTPIATEKKFYQTLGLAWIPPELRENQGEIKAARARKLPHLVTLADIKGDLHTHSNYAWNSSHDYGQHSFTHMLSQAASLGYSYLGLGDHNPSLKSASDSKLESLIQKRSQSILKLQTKPGEKSVKKRTPKIFITLEVDIRPNGDLAIPQSATKHLDYIVASVHSSFHQSKATMTDRVLRALSFPQVKILGHPTGRLINTRPGFELDWMPILIYCRDHHIALEINAHPARLDLSPQLARQAIEFGVKLAINADAHSTHDLQLIHYGVSVARRAWATPSDIINTFNYSLLRHWLKLH